MRSRRVILTMNRIIATAVASVVLVAALSACSSGDPASSPSATSTSAAAATTPTPTPTPTAMSVDAAGKYFLGTVCPVNVASKTLNDALAAQNLDTIHASMDPLIASAQDAARRLDDPKIIWPDIIDQQDVNALRDYYLAALPPMNTLKESASLDQANAVAFPEDTAGDDSQRIRLRLNLSADTTQGC